MMAGRGKPDRCRYGEPTAVRTVQVETRRCHVLQKRGSACTASYPSTVHVGGSLTSGVCLIGGVEHSKGLLADA
jgi:hypothetical protein